MFCTQRKRFLPVCAVRDGAGALAGGRAGLGGSRALPPAAGRDWFHWEMPLGRAGVTRSAPDAEVRDEPRAAAALPCQRRALAAT